ncbi:hypothetical protein [Lactobacillus backii] [Lactiplantibacillus mudanjiangensis]|uniref:hypothetical protein n=1 Tax=Lactiplantibacillus mudanjiangensis TaxID=1296538 RepID=UPI001013DB91|nr:hypothetical protein [Lactobacillus backii] [Lactiplantibacillus mudanjiangensis]
MKALYFYDENKEFDHIELVEDEAPIQERSTFVAPKNGLFEPITWDGEAWNGITEEEWLAAHPAPTPEPTEQDKTNAQILLQVATNKTAQDQFNAQALLQIAAIKGGTN